MKTLLPLMVMISFQAAACSLIDLDSNGNYATSPGREYEVLGQGSPVAVVFTFDPEPCSVESCISIDDQEGKMKTVPVWEDSRNLKLVPLEDPIPGWEYRLEFNGSYTTAGGREVESKLSLPFYWEKSEFTPLKVISSSPRDGIITAEDGIIRITFSSEVDEGSLSRGLSISPDPDTDRTLLGNTLTLAPSIKWENLTDYRIRLSADHLTDREGNRLYPDWEWVFHVETGSSVPSVLNVAGSSGDRTLDFPPLSEDLQNLACDQALRIRFSEPMDRDSAERAFSLTPSLPGDLYWSEDPFQPGWEDLVFLPRDGFEMSREYRLMISSAALARTGIGMRSDFVMDFSARIGELSLSSLECLSYGGFTLNSFGTDRAFDLPAGPVSPFSLIFRFTFSKPFTGDREKQTVQDGLKFSEVFSTGGSPSAGLFSWADDHTMSVLYTGFNADSNSEYYYLLELPGGIGGIMTGDGSFFREDIRQLFRSVRQ